MGQQIYTITELLAESECEERLQRFQSDVLVALV